jgi:hypothetical protein
MNRSSKSSAETTEIVSIDMPGSWLKERNEGAVLRLANNL